jgi:glycosyltransferase involved in cell wall biosynthesis
MADPMTPLVSILIPAYNAAPWVADAIRSALAQTWRPIEIIVIDDGSSDGTFAALRPFASPNVRVATRTNRGASATRNEAFDLCQGEYIQWLDADDLLLPDKVALQMAAARSAGPEVLLSSAWDRFYFRPERAKFIARPLWQNLSPIQWLQTKLEFGDYIALNSWLISRELCHRAGPWDTTLSADDDGDYISRVVCASRRVDFVPGARTLSRSVNPDSLSNFRRSPRWLRSQFTVIRRQIERLRQLDDGPRTRGICLKLLQDTLIYFYPEHPELVAEANAVAASLGAQLSTPDVGWKYRGIRRLFGWNAAKTAQAALPATRAWCDRTWDRCLSRCGL